MKKKTKAGTSARVNNPTRINLKQLNSVKLSMETQNDLARIGFAFGLGLPETVAFVCNWAAQQATLFPEIRYDEDEGEGWKGGVA